MSERLWICIAIGVASFLLSAAVTVAVLVRLPPTYFADGRISLLPGKAPWLRTAAKIGKNVLGALLVVMGIVLSLPGVPGQGILTVLLGLVLLDVPGKRSLERKIMGIRAVRSSLDRLRQRFGREPFVLDA